MLAAGNWKIHARLIHHSFPDAPDDNFASIVTAVEEGRRVWDNLRKLLIFNLPVNFAQGFTIFFAYVVGFKSAPLTAIQVSRYSVLY